MLQERLTVLVLVACEFSGRVRDGGPIEREREQKLAIEFARYFIDCKAKKVCVENPVGILSRAVRQPDQIIQPWQFGHGETKRTCLWLKGLPHLISTDVVSGRAPVIHFESPGPDRQRNRSRTYPGIALAMATQWG